MLRAPAKLHLPDADATAALGAQLADKLAPGDALLLFGDLGAGKTTLARGLIRVWTEGQEEAPSPTYTLAQLYEGPRGPLWHFDLYRIARGEELEELGLEDALAEGPALIEWPERLGGFVPDSRIELRLAMDGTGRRVDIAAFGAALERMK
jgi:tRNA threonylcarbamoyladenosine biosynthesis protein TsaE